jgi:hypothetical protein
VTPTPEREGAGEDDVAPRDQPQSDLVLRTIRDLLEKQADTTDLEEATGMSRSEIEQFVKQYEKVESGPAGPGREIEVEPGASGEDARASADLPGLGNHSISTRAIKDRGGIPQDQIRDNQEGVRFAPPAEFRGKIEGYKNAVSRSRTSTPRSAPAPAPGGGTR